MIRTFKIEEIKENSNFKIIVLGDMLPYSILLKEKINNVSFIAKFNIALYSKGIEYEELKEMIIEYCYANFIEIEVYDAQDVKEAIEQMKEDNEGEKVLLLTNEDVNQEMLKGLDVTINKNILKNLEKELITNISFE